MCAATDVLFGEGGEPALDLVQPRCRGRCEALRIGFEISAEQKDDQVSDRGEIAGAG
jgi:hypothetical protein